MIADAQFSRLRSILRGALGVAATGLFLALPLAPSSARADLLCAPPPFDTVSQIADIAATMRLAIDGFDGLTDTMSHGVSEICVSEHSVDALGYFEPAMQRIVVGDSLSEGLLQAVMVHELRHAEQYAQGLCPGITLGMKDYAEAVFAMEADATVTSLVVAERLRASGQTAMWDAIAHWPMQADIAQRFDQVFTRTGEVTLAARSAFDTWFENDRRIDLYYVASCLDYLDKTEKDHLLPQNDRVAPDYLERLCTLPNGAQYRCEIPDHTRF